MTGICNICKKWNYKTRIGVDQFIQYRSSNNIAFLETPEVCPSNCTRLCCIPEIENLLKEDYSKSYLAKVVNTALDVDKYHKYMYPRAIIAAIKLNQYQVAMQFLTEVSFDVILTKQKLAYHRRYKAKLPNGDETLQKLEQKARSDTLSKDYLQIFGNELQQLVLSLLPSTKLHEVIKSNLRHSLKVQAFVLLPAEARKRYSYEDGSEYHIVSLALLPSETRMLKLKQATTEAEKIALINDLNSTQLQYLVRSDIDLATPSMLKLISQLHDQDCLELLVNHEDPYITAFALYKLSQLSSSSQIIRLKYNTEIVDLLKNNNIYIPAVLSENDYYNILMNLPTHPMAEFLIQMIKDRTILKKLAFHSKLRPSIKNRLNFLQI